MPIKVRGLNEFIYIGYGYTWDWMCKYCGEKAIQKCIDGLIVLECPKCGVKEVIGGDVDG